MRALPLILSEGVDVRFATEVQRVVHSGGGVELKCRICEARDQSRAAVFACDVAVLTLPSECFKQAMKRLLSIRPCRCGSEPRFRALAMVSSTKLSCASPLRFGPSTPTFLTLGSLLFLPKFIRLYISTYH